MRLRAAGIAALFLAVSLSTGADADQIDLAAAQEQFKKSCGTCHTADPDGGKRQGPSLYGIYGRKVGQVEGFKYSATLASGDWVWTEDMLDPWIENSQKAHPGTIMNYRQRNQEKRALIITYLKTLSAGN